MKHLTSAALTLLALIWLALLASAREITDKWDKWDVEKLNTLLHDPSKERIDLDCDACKIMVDAIQFLARLNASEDEVAAVATWLCINLNIEFSYICQQGVQEFKVSRYKFYSFFNCHAGTIMMQRIICHCVSCAAPDLNLDQTMSYRRRVRKLLTDGGLF